MNDINTDIFEFFGIKISRLNEDSFLGIFRKSIEGGIKIKIAYANVNSLNKIYSDDNLKTIYNSFDIIHPDGIGIYKASEFLAKGKGLSYRLTGSDFYEALINESVKNGWSYFFFGHDNETLEKIQIKNPELKISGLQEGYNYNKENVIEKINKADPDIIIIGLSCPIQEKWIYENSGRIKFRVIIAVGDGIKVFAGNKIRGPLFLRKAGLEWLVRFCTNPVTNFRKYILGNPLFIYRVFKEKVKSRLFK